MRIAGAFALGFARYGFYEHLHRLCKSMFETAGIFDFHRLPELFSGHARDDQHPFPAFYPKSCYPQAWSAAATLPCSRRWLAFIHMHRWNCYWWTLICRTGCQPLTITYLKVGKAAIDIRFDRQKDGSSDYKILDIRGHLHVLRQPSPWSLTATWGERIKDAFMSLLPGR